MTYMAFLPLMVRDILMDILYMITEVVRSGEFLIADWTVFAFNVITATTNASKPYNETNLVASTPSTT